MEILIINKSRMNYITELINIYLVDVVLKLAATAYLNGNFLTDFHPHPIL